MVFEAWLPEDRIAQWQSPKSPLAPWLRLCSQIYKPVAIGHRHLRRQRMQRVPIPVISVGSLTAGGTAKTPLVAHLAQFLHSQGHRVAILTRGYGRQDRQLRQVTLEDIWERVGDESLLLARACPDALIYAYANRLMAARRAVEAGAEVILLDDGFQWAGLHRDLDILCLSGDCPPWRDKMIPAGRLRLPLSYLESADFLYRQGPETLPLPPRLSAMPQFSGAYAYRGLEDLDSGARSRPNLAGQGVIWAAGIARPTRFLAFLESLGAHIIEGQGWADHGQAPMTKLHALLKRHRAKPDLIFVCTQKDAPKLAQDPLLASTFKAVVVDLKLRDDAEAFFLALQGVMDRQFQREAAPCRR